MIVLLCKVCIFITPGGTRFPESIPLASRNKELRSLQREGSHGWCSSYIGGVDGTAVVFDAEHQLYGRLTRVSPLFCS